MERFFCTTKQKNVLFSTFIINIPIQNFDSTHPLCAKHCVMAHLQFTPKVWWNWHLLISSLSTIKTKGWKYLIKVCPHRSWSLEVEVLWKFRHSKLVLNSRFWCCCRETHTQKDNYELSNTFPFQNFNLLNKKWSSGKNISSKVEEYSVCEVGVFSRRSPRTIKS